MDKNVMSREDQDLFDKFVCDVADIIENKVNGDPLMMFLIGEELRHRAAKDHDDALNEITNIFLDL